MDARRRNTPTGVGKTLSIRIVSSATPKHPHGRGEDLALGVRHGSPRETPPRAWGRPTVMRRYVARPGNTPTGVGKTIYLFSFLFESRKHPHGRGEDWCPTMTKRSPTETPPRAWGRPDLSEWHCGCLGNTPTGVGKTRFRGSFACRMGKHPHGRGEDHGDRLHHAGRAETPPRAWGRRP